MNYGGGEKQVKRDKIVERKRDHGAGKKQCGNSGGKARWNSCLKSVRWLLELWIFLGVRQARVTREGENDMGRETYREKLWQSDADVTDTETFIWSETISSRFLPSSGTVKIQFFRLSGTLRVPSYFTRFSFRAFRSAPRQKRDMAKARFSRCLIVIISMYSYFGKTRMRETG